ncbi:MAG: peptidoglycan-binding protein [Betaproteobacteria bacterium HGW-Betaproteobacteria-3]|jgi:general secretion pathway protein A|nr:MAG: peptidoglycan-binding protein [Betaproteobacteria bacterium HGW-Betaproteobacteria-3]
MYAQFFGLKQDPFSIAPDPRYLFMSERHREALAHLLYGLGSGGGFVLLSGAIGTGKTTVCRCFLEQVPANCNVAYIFNPKLTVHELLQSVCDEFGIERANRGPGPATVKGYIDPLNAFLLQAHAAGQHNVLIIDEAQNLSAAVLEQLRLLTNLETNERKLLQIILIGQPELRRMLARPELEQVAQRVIARYHLRALTEEETLQYIPHRMAVAGVTTARPFDRRAMKRIHALCGGVPRRINLLCDRALLGAYAGGQTVVTRAIVDKAADEVFDQEAVSGPYSRVRIAVAATVAAVLVAGGALLVAERVGWSNGWSLLRSAVRVGATADPVPASGASTAVSVPVPSGGEAARASPPAPEAPIALHSAAQISMPPAAGPADPVRPVEGGVATLIAAEDDAWRELARVWSLTLGAGDPCEAARRQGVNCFKRKDASLAMIRLLDRPGVLLLRDDAGKNGYAVLTRLDEQAATLRTASGTATVALEVLGQLWRGDFATLWRGPEPAGRRGLVQQLSALPGAQGFSPNRPVDDATLKARVHAFQVKQGLVPDGLAGPITQMQLNRATGVPEPRLETER